MLCAELEAIRESTARLEHRLSTQLADVHPDYADSARNLVHYVALRQQDLRELQRQLANRGLSPLGGVERHVLASVQAVRSALEGVTHEDTDLRGVSPTAFEESERQLERHARDLLGEDPGGRSVAIMVTLPTEAAGSYELVRDMLDAGVDIARINCAHDTRDDWQQMIAHIRKASDELGRHCKIFMDLAGSKIRTGSLVPGPGVLGIKPRRDAYGRIISCKRVRLVADDITWPGRKVAVLPVPRQCIQYAAPGDEIRFRDTRGRKRSLKIVVKDADSLVAEASKRAYIESGTKLRLIRTQTGERLKYRVGRLPPVEQLIILRTGDTLILTGDAAPGKPAMIDNLGTVLEPARIACSAPEVFRHLNAGDAVSFNDGKIEGVVRSASEHELTVTITQAKPSGSRLRADRSINFPKKDIERPSLTDADREDLAFITEHADAVGLSFVKSPDDVIALQDALTAFPNCQLGIVPKIETERGFRALPQILLATMRRYPAGIMIARGDLAVECGWERLAEIQEEILWLCEAARLPVIWATQVLEDKTKKGRASRAEVTDAAMSQRADCVMLNKGPHILAAIHMLDDILRRMQDHQHKKMAKLRRLAIADV